MATTRRVKLECLASFHSSEHAVAFAVEAVSMGNVALKEWPAEHANDACQRVVVDQAGRQSAHLNVFVPRSGRRSARTWRSLLVCGSSHRVLVCLDSSLNTSSKIQPGRIVCCRVVSLVYRIFSPTRKLERFQPKQEAHRVEPWQTTCSLPLG